jgi:hypothetical protein
MYISASVAIVPAVSKFAHSDFQFWLRPCDNHRLQAHGDAVLKQLEWVGRVLQRNSGVLGPIQFDSFDNEMFDARPFPRCDDKLVETAF